MLLDIRYANKTDKKNTIDFLQKNVIEGSDSISSYEFMCPFGASAAIDRKQVIIAVFCNEVIGGLRLYPRKKDNIVSIYQFAIDKRFRSQGLIKEILKYSGYKTFESICLIESNFNSYYSKTGWKNIKSDDKYNFWTYEIDRTYI